MESYDRFNKELNALLNSNLLSSVNVIRDFLIFLANDTTCREILREANEKVNLNAEYNRVFTENKGLPKSPEKIIAVITGALYFLDTAKVSITSFLKSVYPDKTSDAAYSEFLENFIRPYGENFLMQIKGEPIEEVRLPKQSVLDKMNEDVKSVLSEMKYNLKSLKITSIAADGIAESMDGLAYTLQYGDPILTRYAYVAFLTTLELFGVKCGFEEDLNKILKLYGVL